MRHEKLFTLLSCLALLVHVSMASAKDQKAAEALIQKSIKARGMMLEKPVTAQSWKLTGKFHLGGQAMPFKGEAMYQVPNQFRMNIEMDFGGQQMKMQIGVNGDSAFQAANDQVEDVQDKKKEYMMHQAYMFEVMSMYPLLSDKSFALDVGPDDKVNNQTVKTVVVKKKGHPDITLGFDEQSGLMVKLTTTVLDEFKGWAETKEDIYFENYRSVDGLQWFGKIRIMRDGEMMIEEELTDQKIHKSIDAKQFAKPEGK